MVPLTIIWGFPASETTSHFCGFADLNSGAAPVTIFAQWEKIWPLCAFDQCGTGHRGMRDHNPKEKGRGSHHAQTWLGTSSCSHQHAWESAPALRDHSSQGFRDTLSCPSAPGFTQKFLLKKKKQQINKKTQTPTKTHKKKYTPRIYVYISCA